MEPTQVDHVIAWKDFGIFVSYAFSALLGVIVKTLWDAVQELRKDLARLREEIAKDYMPRIEIRDIFEQLLSEVRAVNNGLIAHEQRERQWHKETVDEVHRLHLEHARITEHVNHSKAGHS